MRMLVIKHETDAKALSTQLVSAKQGTVQAESALKKLQAANPHVDIAKLRPGAVLLIPDEPGFKAGASDSVPGGTLEDFQKFVSDALGDAAAVAKKGNAERAAERADFAAAIKPAAIKRLIEADPDLKEQVAEAAKAFKDEQTEADEDEKALAAANKAALAKLAALSKLFA